MKLFFCQNDCPIRGEFWQKNSFITHIFLSYDYFEIWLSLLIYETPSRLGVLMFQISDNSQLLKRLL